LLLLHQKRVGGGHDGGHSKFYGEFQKSEKSELLKRRCLKICVGGDHLYRIWLEKKMGGDSKKDFGMKSEEDLIFDLNQKNENEDPF